SVTVFASGEHAQAAVDKIASLLMTLS
ncbi:MAG: phosphotransferase system HPr-like phosphotransfer protein, partial [Shewanella psychromarinicola]